MMTDAEYINILLLSKLCVLISITSFMSIKFAHVLF